MAKKGGKKHLKKLAAPRARKILRKDTKWTVKARPGPHPARDSIPILILIRDYLKRADTFREAERILKSKKVFVDGRIVKDPKFPVGFMDVLSFPEINEFYRIILDKLGRIELQKLNKNESNFKLCKIEKKTVIKKGKIQITLHDGRNMIVDGKFRIGDVLKVSIPDQKIQDHFELKKGNIAYIIKGKHAGETGVIEEIQLGSITRNILVAFKKGEETFTTPLKYVFLIGKEKPAVEIKH